MEASGLEVAIALRPPETVMRLSRLGSFHQCRLSFMRTLLRRMKREAWTFDRPVFDIDAKGVGTAVYSAHGPERSYSLVCFAHDLPPDQRSDRVIAEAWDSTFALFDGVPDEDDVERLSWNVPKQEAGRITSSEISLSRANRSVRLFDHVVERLAAGRQPDPEKVEAVGYLMRTTAVYGSGKFGAADRETIADRPEFKGPFQAEMLSVFLTRAYVLDLVEHLAGARCPHTVVPLDPGLRRRFGVGNSTGLGMAPFIVNHPMLLNNWIAARETALARVRGLAKASVDEKAAFQTMVARARKNAEIRDNTISAALLPIDLLRCKLSFFGANHFDPRSDRWVRINMFRDAPFPHEIATDDGDDWCYPPVPAALAGHRVRENWAYP